MYFFYNKLNKYILLHVHSTHDNDVNVFRKRKNPIHGLLMIKYLSSQI